MSLLDRPPWDVAPFCQLPTMAKFSNAALGTLLLPPDTTRIWLAISGSSIGLSPVPIPATTTGGLDFGSSTFPGALILSYWRDGPIVMSPWYLSNGATPTVYVYSQCLTPGVDLSGPPPPLLSTIDRGPRRPAVKIESRPGVNGKRGILDYWLSLVSRMTGGGRG